MSAGRPQATSIPPGTSWKVSPGSNPHAAGLETLIWRRCTLLQGDETGHWPKCNERWQGLGPRSETEPTSPSSFSLISPSGCGLPTNFFPLLLGLPPQVMIRLSGSGFATHKARGVCSSPTQLFCLGLRVCHPATICLRRPASAQDLLADCPVEQLLFTNWPLVCQLISPCGA